MTILFSSLFLAHVALGILIAVNPSIFKSPDGDGVPFPPIMGLAIAAFAATFVLTGWLLGGLTIYSGRCLKRRRYRMLSLIVAGIQCAFVPLGTVLGVLTIIVLQRDSVRRLYGE